MAYDYNELERMAVEAIKEHKITKITYVPSFLPCVTSCFYDHQLEKSEAIKEALYRNCVEKKTKMTDRWVDSDNPTLQIAAFKLMADDDELTRLNSQKIEAEHTLKGSGIKIGFADDNDGQ